MITAGVVVALLTAMNFLLPLSIRFKESRIIFFYPRRIDRIKYEKVRRCELTAVSEQARQGEQRPDWMPGY